MVLNSVISNLKGLSLKVIIFWKGFANEMKVGESGVLGKLDMEKAYDLVNWEFLDYML